MRAKGKSHPSNARKLFFIAALLLFGPCGSLIAQYNHPAEGTWTTGRLSRKAKITNHSTDSSFFFLVDVDHTFSPIATGVLLQGDGLPTRLYLQEGGKALVQTESLSLLSLDDWEKKGTWKRLNCIEAVGKLNWAIDPRREQQITLAALKNAREMVIQVDEYNPHCDMSYLTLKVDGHEVKVDGHNTLKLLEGGSIMVKGALIQIVPHGECPSRAVLMGSAWFVGE